MEAKRRHWTERDTADFLFRVAADFASQVELKLTDGPILQKDLAHLLNVTEAAVSQTLTRPGNMKLEKMIKYARALGMKLSVVLYDDGDAENKRGPVHSDIFKICWEKQGKPMDFWAFTNTKCMAMADTNDGVVKWFDNVAHFTSSSSRLNRTFKALDNKLEGSWAITTQGERAIAHGG